ncbi:hypothetical protein HPB49_011645 [Dermacentor silvarum]|uniref:Uncharacterized protein n=1 Tax=Dermacentor silvarum TaxID=543639 RepID=A0ACB8D544_DERSI|nr:hypothetical protein HPB49_011645 [Dermacentor silvarum]
MAQPAKRAKYAAKDLATKVKILKALKDGASREEVMRQFDVKRSTLSTYVKNEAQIMEAFEGEKFHAGRKRLRTAAHPQLEEALLQWIAATRDSKLPLSGPLICAQAESGFVRPETCESPQPAVPEEEGDDIAFAGLLPSEVQLADYVAIDDGVVVAGQLTDDDIISGALGAADEASDEDDPCGELRPVRRTAKEAADALAVLEEFCYDVPGNTLALEGLSHARKLVLSAQLAAKKQTSITDFFTK